MAERLRTRTYLASSEPARAWAGEIAAQLAPLAGAGLAEIPAAASAGTDTGARGPQRVGDLSSSSPPSAGAATPVPPARPQRSSRVGGAVLLAVIAVAVIVAVVLITGGSSNSNKPSTAASKTATSATKSGPTIENTIALKPSHGSTSHSIGVVYVLAEGSKQAFFIEAQHIPRAKGFYYAVWLYSSHTSALPLSKTSDVGSSHKLAGGSALPSNSGQYREILLTEETNPKPSHPGHVVLRAPFSLH